MTFERTGIRREGEEWAVIHTSPRHMADREYWMARHGDVWVPRGHISGHALEYARMELDEPVLNRRLGDGQLTLDDFGESVESRSEMIAVA